MIIAVEPRSITDLCAIWELVETTGLYLSCSLEKLSGFCFMENF